MLASHDLQAPLATIRGYMELIETTYADVFDERATDWVGRVSEAAARMSELVNSLLDFSRIGGSQVREDVSVVELVKEVHEDLGELVTSADAEIVIDARQPDGGGRPVTAAPGAAEPDPERAQVPPSRPHPHCEVIVQERDADWLVTVADNAVGIPAEHRESVFSMFARMEGDGPGHGIGLAACRQIVERHGGTIWVDPNPRGPGSRFCFTLPR